MISHAWYVTCDICGDPTPISTESGKEARRLARIDGYTRRRIEGRMMDLCPNCRGARLRPRG